MSEITFKYEQATEQHTSIGSPPAYFEDAAIKFVAKHLSKETADRVEKAIWSALEGENEHEIHRNTVG